MPPWPGKMLPESFTCACRFMRLSIRSPTIDIATVIARQQRQRDQLAARATPSNHAADFGDQHASYHGAVAPAQVLPGLICGRQLALAERAAAEVGADVGRPHDHQRKQGPPVAVRLARG